MFILAVQKMIHTFSGQGIRSRKEIGLFIAVKSRFTNMHTDDFYYAVDLHLRKK